MVMDTSEWNQARLQRLKNAIARAEEDGMRENDTLLFDGEEFHLGYAKYLVEYLEGELR